MFEIFKIVMSNLKIFNNNKKFFVIDFVISFYKNNFFKKKCYQILLIKIGLKSY